MKWKIAFNPFERVSEKGLALTGVLTTLFAIILFWQTDQSNDGIYHITPQNEISFMQAFAEAVTYTLLVSFLLLLVGKIVNKRTRAVDLLNATMIHRIPLTLGIAVLQIPVIKNAFEKVIEASQKNTYQSLSGPNLIIASLAGILMLALFIYAIILLVNGFSVAVNAKKPFHYVLFALSLIIAEVSYRLVLYPLLLNI